jgi:GT2 family glycosyltransferase
MAQNNFQSVSVIFPTLNRGEVLINSLRDILRQKYPEFEVVIIDQSDTEQKEINDFLKNHKNKIKFFHINKKGSCLARNYGAQKANGDILLFLDDDIRVNDPNFITYHAENFQNNRVGIVGGRITGDFEAKARGGEVGKLKYWGLREITNFSANKKQEIDHAAGGNMSCRKDIFFKINGYNEIYVGNAHREETDFCLRVKRTGYKLIFEPKAVVDHLMCGRGGNRKKDIYSFRYWLVRNNIIFALENYSKLIIILYILQAFLWAGSSAIKRRDIKMFSKMSSGITDAIRFHRNYKETNGQNI